ncbi:MAG: CARDB domain-containing protein [Polyangiaceae bacterium]
MLKIGRLLLLISVAALGAACGDPEVINPPEGGSGGSGGSTGGSSKGGSGGEGNTFPQGGSMSTGPMDPCVGVVCDPGLQCEANGDTASCVPITCAEANCSATEECQIQPNGGAICVDISCTDDLDCAATEFCNGTICVDDICNPGETSCTGDELFECAANGSANASKATCGSDAYFDSNCIDDMMGLAFCGCQDDWDCPTFMDCDVSECTGTGKAPTCSLPPSDFSTVLPANEIQWGGTSEQQRFALGSPFEKSAQVVMTPLVINLDDDNGDGLVNERDFPEVVFMTFCNSEISNNGILRAIHGGGVNKGKDYFAVCGAQAWHEGDPLPTTCATGADTCAAATLNSTSPIAAGDIDGDGFPEIVAPTENSSLQIFRHDGTLALTLPNNQWSGYTNPAPAIVNIDNKGFAEVVVGRNVFTFANDMNGNLVFVDRFSGNLMHGSQGQGPSVCPANLVGDARQEIVAGTTLYGFPNPPAGATTRADCATFPPTNAEETAFCNGQLTVVWDGQTVNGAVTIPNTIRDGFCAIADVLGTDPVLAPSPTNPLDGKPDVVLINEGTLLILDSATGTVLRKSALGLGADGGPPNIDDFDGDGFPEIGTAFGAAYNVIDLQDPTASSCRAWTAVLDDAVSLTGPQSNPARTPPAGACTTDADCSAQDPGTVCNETVGRCVCLHNSWARKTEDDSSRVTGSSVFDFNGDGGAEVIYNDECFFRVYDGLTGSVYFKEASESRTRIEYPVVADVDNDGNAEIVFGTSNESGFCSVGASYNYNNGIEVWGEPTDKWVSARRIWSEHSYHVTNVTEGGSVPVTEPENWLPYNGRLYNTYRSNPRSYGVAPDLAVTAIQFTSPGEACGTLSDQIDITFEIKNLGDLRVGPGVTVHFEGTWASPALTELLYQDAAHTLPLEVVLQNSLEPGDSVILTVSYDSTTSTPMTPPDSIKVIVDALSQESECDETNNELTEPVAAGNAKADLLLAIDDVNGLCPPTVTATVTNAGSADASGVVVRFFAGDPNQGGAPIEDVTVPGTIPAGGSVMITPVLGNFPSSAFNVTIYGVVDPDNLVDECNDGNNKDAANETLSCAPS